MRIACVLRTALRTAECAPEYPVAPRLPLTPGLHVLRVDVTDLATRRVGTTSRLVVVQ
jgi:hypothetical protein